MMRTHRVLVSLTNMQSNMLMIVFTIPAVRENKDPNLDTYLCISFKRKRKLVMRMWLNVVSLAILDRKYMCDIHELAERIPTVYISS